MNDIGATPGLDLLDATTTSGGCGCGGCGCGGGDSTALGADPREAPSTRPTQRFAVTEMTCGHCVEAVTRELKAIDGVTDVRVDLVSGGTSTVTVTSAARLDEDVVAAALDDAGGYQLA